MKTELRADQIGAAAREDLQFTVPWRPSARLGTRLRRSGDVVLLDGADRAQAFTGSFAAAHLTAIVDLCDGTRSHAEIADALGMDERTVADCLALLWTAGAVEEGPTAGEDTVPLPLPAAVFLSRLGNATGANASWTDAAARLRTDTVALTGDAALVAVATELLGELCEIVGADDAPALTVHFETEVTTEADRATAAARRGPLLRVRADADRVVVGPYVHRGTTPCLRCGAREDAALRGPVRAEHRDLVVGLAAHHVVSLLGRTTTTHLPGDVEVVAFDSLSTSHHPPLTVPGCPDCSWAEGPEAEQVRTGARYEASVVLPPRAFLAPRDHQAHYYTGNQELQTRFRAWPSSPRVGLPPVAADLLPEAPATAGRALDVAAFSTVLAVAFGIDHAASDGRRTRRWTASGGNIGCTTAYVVVRDETLGRPGVHAYAPDGHALVHVSDDVPPGEAPCDLVITGDLDKITSKYGTFGLRLTFLDAGCNLTSARATAAHLGLGFRVHRDWDDLALAAALRVDPSREPIAAVAALGGIDADRS